MRKIHAPKGSMFQKNYLQRNVWNGHKIKLYHKTVTLHCCCADNVKYRFLSKTFVNTKWIKTFFAAATFDRL